MNFKKTRIMKKIKIAALFLLMFAVVTTAPAQLNKLGKNLVKKAEQKVEQKVNQTSGTSAEKPPVETEPEKNNGQVVVESSVSETGVKILYVSKQNGNNKNNGSKAGPLKNLDKAIILSEPGGKIYIAGGIETGTLNVGFIKSNKPVQIYGSWDESFEKAGFYCPSHTNSAR